MSAPNSTHSGHFHLPDSDGAIILMLGAVVFLTFALGMMSQLCEVPILFFVRKKRYWYEEDDDDLDLEQGLGQTALNHRMSDFEADTGTGRRSQPRVLDRGSQRELRPEPEHRPPSRPMTRYGSIQQHMVDVNGIRKLVLVVDIDKYGREASSEASPDEYAEWFERWRQQQLREAELAVSEEPLDESAPLLGPWP